MKSTPEPPQIYQVSRGWKIFLGIGGPALLVLFVWVFNTAINRLKSDSSGGWFLLLISIAMILVLFFGTIDVFRSKLIVYSDKFVQTGIFYKLELKLSDVEGYQKVEGPYKSFRYTCYRLIPKDTTKKKINIYSHLEGYNTLVEFVESRFENIDIIEEKKDQAELLSDQRFGQNQKEREQFFKKISAYHTLSELCRNTHYAVGLFLSPSLRDCYLVGYYSSDTLDRFNSFLQGPH